MADAPQTMISVKKADGSVVKMTLAEFKLYRESLKAQEHENNKALKQEENAVMIEGTQELATTTPVVDVFVNEARAKMWGREDHKSLLDEELTEKDVKVKEVAPTTVPSRDSALLMVILSALPFQMSEEVKGRLQSLIESRIKDVRSDDDIILYGTKSIANGGLGITEEQAKILLQTILDTLNLKPTEEVKPDMPALVADASVEPEEMPEEKIVSAKSASSFSYDHSRDELPWQPRPATVVRSMTSAIPATADGRPLVHDINPPQEAPRTMGPVDEFRYCTLTDLHRLGTNAEQTAASMIEKFTFLKNESFVLYLDAIDAFRQSPVYKKYQSVLLTALNEGISLETVLESDEDGMTMMDIESIVNIMKVVGY